MALPISPSQAKLQKQEAIPSFVIDAFNELLVEKLQEKIARITQDDVIALVLKKASEQGHPELTRAQVFANHWLDVEPLFEASGWQVHYYKPAFYEDGQPMFTFESL